MAQKNKSKASVFIKKEAFRNMITHVLRFGHPTLKKSVEVMGYCLGNIKNYDQIELTNTVPISHGNQIEVTLSQNQLKLLQDLREKYKNQDLEIVGWYISHPSYGLNMTNNDIQNHLYFQNDEIKNAICIIFDHTKLLEDSDFGFKIHRLKDYNKGKESEILDLNYEIEAPDSFDYFKWVKKFMEDFHMDKPILIKELEEIPTKLPSELQEIPKDEIEVSESETKLKDNLSNLMSDKLSNLNQLFYSELENWTKKIENGTLIGTEGLLNSTRQLNDQIPKGLTQIDNWINDQINELTELLYETISKNLKKRLEIQKETIKKIKKTNEEMQNTTNNQFNETTESLSNKISVYINKIEDDLQLNIKSNEEQKNLTEKLEKITPDLKDNIEAAFNEIKSRIGSLITDNNKQIQSSLEDLKFQNEKINTEYLKLEKKLKLLEKEILTLRNI